MTKPRSLGSPKCFMNPSLVHAQGRGCPRGLMTLGDEHCRNRAPTMAGRCRQDVAPPCGAWKLLVEAYHVEDKEKIKTKLGLRTSSLLRGSRSFGFNLDGKLISMKRGQTPFQTLVSRGLKVTPIYIQLGGRRSEVKNRTEESSNLSY